MPGIIELIEFILRYRVRGALSSTLIFTTNIGITFGYILGYYCEYVLTPLVAIVLTVVFVVSFFFLPETPLYLVKKDRISVNIKRTEINDIDRG